MELNSTQMVKEAACYKVGITAGLIEQGVFACIGKGCDRGVNAIDCGFWELFCHCCCNTPAACAKIKNVNRRVISGFDNFYCLMHKELSFRSWNQYARANLDRKIAELNSPKNVLKWFAADTSLYKGAESGFNLL